MQQSLLMLESSAAPGNSPSHTPLVRSRPAGSRPRVLLVEPAAEVRAVVAEALKDLGFRVHAAPDLEAGLHSVRGVDAAVMAIEQMAPDWAVSVLRREHPAAGIILIGPAQGAGVELPDYVDYLPRPVEIRMLERYLRAHVSAA